MRPNDLTYFRTREMQEKIAAATATCAEARERHLELAASYRLRVLFLSGSAPGRADRMTTATLAAVA